ncbi:MAG: ribose 5-phosphate isomerase B [Vicingaceae bacterium]|nr:MAG: ribose 5-phosphate isomerase B [Vicingaceae bacterium]
MKIAIGSDHAGFELKEFLKENLKNKVEIIDEGTFSRESCDYPDYAHKVAEDIQLKKADFGILICGSGNGVNMTANKHKGVRSALCWNKEIAALARQHNNANACALPARFIDKHTALEIVNTFLEEKFEGGRHERRVNKIEV